MATRQDAFSPSLRLPCAHERGSLPDLKCCLPVHLCVAFMFQCCWLASLKRIGAPEITFIIDEGLLFPIPGRVLQTVVVDRILTALKELAPWWGSAGGQVVAIDTACPPYGLQFRVANRTGFRKNFPSTAGQSKLLFFFLIYFYLLFSCCWFNNFFVFLIEVELAYSVILVSGAQYGSVTLCITQCSS